MIKATGMVRRVDDLGRVVMPKEIRRALRISEGDPMEIFLTEDGVYLKKSNPPSTLMDAISEVEKAIPRDGDHLEIRRKILKQIREIKILAAEIEYTP